MPTLPTHAAAYTRTGIVRRFLEQLSESTPARVDSAYAEGRLGLKGGDVRAFLQSMRVLGFVDPYGAITERGRRTRALTQRAAAVREGLVEAYPELVRQWDRRGGMSRQEIEDFFKYEYGLSASSAGPAAKLFEDLMREYGQEVPGPGSGDRGAGPRRPTAGGADRQDPGTHSLEPQPQTLGGRLRTGDGQEREPGPECPPQPERAPSPGDVRLAALDAIKSSLRIDITAEWDEQKIELVFDRMERLVRLAIGGPPDRPAG